MPKEARKRGKKAAAQRTDERAQEIDLQREQDEAEKEAIIKDKEQQSAFFGLVSDEELEYFKTAESTLAVDGFANNEEKKGFVASVLEEAKGKELKLMTNQICSKLVERLVLEASPSELKRLAKVVEGQLKGLAEHKYASHCVETLLVRCAAQVERELIDPEGSKADVQEEEQWTTMENLIVMMTNTAKRNAKDWVRHPYAAHVLRLNILILAGREMPQFSSSSESAKSSTGDHNSSLLRSKKSRIARKMIEIGDSDEFGKSYQVPSSFASALGELSKDVIRELDTTSAREMAIDKVGSPLAQLLIMLECDKLKAKKKGKVPDSFLVAKLFVVDEKADVDQKEKSFVEFLLSDPVGSHFFENIIVYLPPKVLTRLSKLYMYGRLEKLAARPTANYVIQALLQTTCQHAVVDELLEKSDVLPTLPKGLLKSLLQTSYRSEDLLKHLSSLISQSSVDEFLSSSNPDAGTSHFYQALLPHHPDLLLARNDLTKIGLHPIHSRLLESVLIVTKDNQVARRRVLAQLVPSVVTLAVHASGSHIVDALWRYSFRLKHVRESIAAALIGSSETVKTTKYGRVVWKNWKLDLYERKRFEWWNEVKKYEDTVAEEMGVEKGGQGVVVKAKYGKRPFNKKEDVNKIEVNKKRQKPSS